MKILILLLAVFVIAASSAIGQQPESWQTFFNSDFITSIDIKDDQIWMGTSVGLVNYDLATGEKTWYNTNNSPMPVNKVNKVIIKDYGNIWILTDAGAVRFNTLNNMWVLFNSAKIDLPSNIVYDVVELYNPFRFWLATAGGLVRSDGVNSTVYTEENSPLPLNNVRSLAADSIGGLWIGTLYDRHLFGQGAERFGGLAYLKDEEWTVHTRVNQPAMPAAHIYCLEVDPTGNLWIGSDFMALRVNGLSWEQFEIDFMKPWLIFASNNGVKDFNFAPDGSVWLSTAFQGIAKYADGEFTAYHPMNSDFAFTGVAASAFDKDGRIWFGCYGGIMRYNADKTWMKLESLIPSGIPDNNISTIGSNGAGNVYFAMPRQAGIIRYDGFEWFAILDSIKPGGVGRFARGPQGNLWFGHNKRGVGQLKHGELSWYDSASGASRSNWISSLSFDNSGTLWVGSRMRVDIETGRATLGGVTFFDGSTWSQLERPRLPKETPSYHKAVAVDKHGVVWVGTSTCGLARFKNDEWTYFDTLNSEMPANDCRLVIADKEDRIFVITPAGLCMFENDESTALTPDNTLLPTTNVHDIAIDKANRVWIATEEGLVQIEDDVWRLFTMKNSALLSNRISAVSISNNDDVWIGTRDAGAAVYLAGGTSTGLAENTEKQGSTKLSPQPARDIVKLTLQSEKGGRIELFTAGGRRVGDWHSTQAETTISVAQQPAGLYFLRCSAANSSDTQPLLIQR